MTEGGGVAFVGFAINERIEIRLAGSRHQQDIAIVRDACAAEMCMAEAIDNLIGVVIAGATIPAGQSCVGTELDHPKRQRCTGKCVAVSAGADERIDILRQVLLSRNSHRDKQQTEQCDANSSHGLISPLQRLFAGMKFASMKGLPWSLCSWSGFQEFTQFA